MNAWQYIVALAAVLTPLVGAPLTALTFYLRALRDQHAERLDRLGQRTDRLEELAESLGDRLSEFQRNFATKEEWVRENMLARSERQWLTEAVVTLQAEARAADRLESLCRSLLEPATGRLETETD